VKVSGAPQAYPGVALAARAPPGRRKNLGPNLQGKIVKCTPHTESAPSEAEKEFNF